jgi:hypothetical protein
MISRKPRLAFIIELRSLADENGIPANILWPNHYPGAIALRIFTQSGHDHTFKFSCGLRWLLRHLNPRIPVIVLKGQTALI